MRESFRADPSSSSAIEYLAGWLHQLERTLAVGAKDEMVRADDGNGDGKPSLRSSRCGRKEWSLKRNNDFGCRGGGRRGWSIVERVNVDKFFIYKISFNNRAPQDGCLTLVLDFTGSVRTRLGNSATKLQMESRPVSISEETEVPRRGVLGAL